MEGAGVGGRDGAPREGGGGAARGFPARAGDAGAFEGEEEAVASGLVEEEVAGGRAGDGEEGGAPAVFLAAIAAGEFADDFRPRRENAKREVGDSVGDRGIGALGSGEAGACGNVGALGRGGVLEGDALACGEGGGDVLGKGLARQPTGAGETAIGHPVAGSLIAPAEGGEVGLWDFVCWVIDGHGGGESCGKRVGAQAK